MYAAPLPSCSRMCPAYEVTAYEVTTYEVTAYVCPEYDVPLEYRVCSSVQAPVLTLVLTAASAVVRLVDSLMTGQPAYISGP